MAGEADEEADEEAKWRILAGAVGEEADDVGHSWTMPKTRPNSTCWNILAVAADEEAEDAIE